MSDVAAILLWWFCVSAAFVAGAMWATTQQVKRR